MRLSVIVILIGAAFLSTSPMADPNSTFRMLRSEPVTALDWGLAALRRDLNPLEVLGPGSMSVSVTADAEKPSITIIASTPITAPNDSVGKEWCSNAINALKRRLAVPVYPTTPDASKKSLYESFGSTMPTYFVTERMGGKISDRTFGQDLDSVTQLQATILLQRGEKDILTCEGSLSSEQ